ncbi:effector-associated domain EAD1-containing protein [Streptomyces sp. NPDC004069]
MARRQDVQDALADLFRGEAEVRLLLEPLGVDLTRLPQVHGSTPRAFWFTTCSMVENGAFPVTLQGLVAAAAEEFPHHPVLRKLMAEADTEADPPAPSPDGGLPDPTRVLFLVSAPSGPPQLRQSEEFRAIQEAAAVGRGRRLDLRIRTAARNRDVIPALLAEAPHVVHFAGHGSPNGFLLMEADDGQVAPVRAPWLNEALVACGGTHALVLTACHLGRDLEHFQSGTAAAIGCDAPLPDLAALAFSRDFYGALSHGRSVAEAFTVGRAGVRMTAGTSTGLCLLESGRGPRPPGEAGA